MTVFRYTGRTVKGVIKKGTIDAIDKKAAIAKLRKQGINAREIEESKSIFHKEISFGNSVKLQDFVIYCRQFSTLVRAGVTIVDATKILADQTTNKKLKRALEQMEEDIRLGLPLFEVAAKRPKIFPSLFVNMVQGSNGNMDGTLERLADTFGKT